jgi:phosphoribosylaminoimidazole-succinocarboxamide synthase
MEPYVVIIQGSKSDSPFVESMIIPSLENAGILYRRRIASAHRTADYHDNIPSHLDLVLNQIPSYDNFAVITVAGRSDGLSGRVAGRPGFSGRVVAYPPDIDEDNLEKKKFSSAYTPPGVDVKFASSPESLVNSINEIFSVYNPDKIDEVYRKAVEKRNQTAIDDGSLQGVGEEDSLPYTFLQKGKVRNIHDLGGELLIRSTDRISAFDVVLPDKIPKKGEVLNMISYWWFEQTKDIIPNHIIRLYDRRSVIVKKAKKLPIEVVVRGYLFGSMLGPYNAGDAYCGIRLPPGLRKAEKLPEPILTPTTKAETGHDEALTMKEVADMIGSEHAQYIGDKAMEIYLFARKVAERAGIICADTKFEFGLVEDEKIIIIDELLTPDSSRWWDAESYEIGKDPESYDKQPVRDWLVNEAKWDKQPPAPSLPSEVISSTTERYIKAYEKLTGLKF